MCESSDEDMSHDADPFGTVPPPSGSSGSPEPQDSITANPLPQPFWEAGPRPELGNPQKRKGATVTGELENSPSTKRLQPEQQSIPTPVKTPTGTAAHQLSSSPLQRLSWDGSEPSAPAERHDSTPPQEQDLPQELDLEDSQDEQGIPGPSRETENVWFPQDPHEKRGRDLLLLMEKVPEKDRDQLIQLMPIKLERLERCWAKNLCFSDSIKVNVLERDHKRFLIKINWPQDSMMTMDITALLSKKLFPKMVGDFNKVGLMTREWLKHSGNVNPDKMFQILEEEIKPTKKTGDDLAKLWRLTCDREPRHLTTSPCALSLILDMGDTYL
ncbi:uncharacterized protein FTJAE_10570 [Fusarium tjaetaba]|uniref:Uncharacterized protein n=1 Tax=Fusarium tjaetaba TaxID=1567544 RepID=A0A8H5QZ11_9HYPO|nr:uncharacterized protein FTJAE_10570 [Fusarium tjaetaba]KAF5623625.1 hypothetical protein FTJAE_10570 [Fusarium tjaetaba]